MAECTGHADGKNGDLIMITLRPLRLPQEEIEILAERLQAKYYRNDRETHHDIKPQISQR